MKQDHKAAMQAINNEPDIREDKVSQIQEQIANGTYDVSPQDVAARIFRELK